MRNPFRRRSATDLSVPAKVVAFLLLCGWALVVLFPIYWLVVTSFKTPYDVDRGPFYVPFVDFQPTLDAWRYILVELGNDTLRPYVNTVIVGLTSSAIALVMGSFTAYALVRCRDRGAGAHRNRLGGRDLRRPRPDHRPPVPSGTGEQRHRVLADLTADPPADRDRHPVVRPFPAGRHA